MREALKARTRRFAVDVFTFCNSLPDQPQCWVIGKQLMRSASSVGANYRAACRAPSRAAFVAKMAVVEEEADESLFWMEILVDLRIVARADVAKLMQESSELLTIAAASKKTARRNG